ncbi:signal peptidase I [alpha proteobacterium U9-1i]|nr:signal peptidase I [alpha proteobacterium U9-1i]
MIDAGRGTQTRRVRPWIAALLTFLGWGVGFYYARSRAAWGWAFASVFVGFILVIAIFAFAAATGSLPFPLLDPANLTPIDFIQMGLSLVVAVIAWITTARRPHVEAAGPIRLLGYLAILIAPMLIGLTVAVGVRALAIQPFRIPSAAMAPTINVGDYVAVSKSSYGYSRYSFAPVESLLPAGRWLVREPARGDIVVFRPVPEPHRDFIKRLVGLPGDRIQMIDGVLHINGEAVARASVGEMMLDGQAVRAFRETLPNNVSYVTFDAGESALDNTSIYEVPEGHYFMMGDHRDNSADSRVPTVVGFVPRDNLIGRVDYIIPAAR